MYNNKAEEFGSILAANQQMTGGYPFLYPSPYMPGGNLGGNNSDMGSLIAMFAGPLMGAMAGPENFIPNLMPGQALMDQFAMRNYQRETLESSLAVARGGSAPVAQMLSGLRSAFTDEPVSQFNREQASNLAGMVTHPIAKALAGSMLGPETVEAALYGSKGDPTALSAGTNRIGYFRTDPTGNKRMTAESLTNYTESLYADLYEPKGNLDELEADARKSRSAVNPVRNRRIEQSQQQLKELANMEESTIVSDSDVVDRMLNADDSEAKISRLYRKYKSDGKAGTAEEKAKELVQFDRAVQEANVLDGESNEVTIGQLRREAERAPVKRMRGFMAGQVATMQQQLFEEGRLPQSLGDMSAEERFKVVGQTERDDETMRRLARKMARTELEQDSNFKDLTTEQQDRLIDAKLPEAQRKLEKTESEAKKFAAGDANAMSIEDLEKQGGMNLLTVDADAKRAGQTIEKYSGALAAVRQIFGDNGNPNAPVPMLIKTLNALTNNAMGQFEPGRVEAELRKMQSLAKETGTGLEQLAEISTNVTGQGRMFGLNDATSMQATSATLAALRVAQQDGTFNSNRFGSMNRGEYTDRMGRQIQSGAASNNAKAMAAMARMYEADPQKYAGTEMERAVQAYKDPKSGGRYIDPTTGQERNLYQDVGAMGPNGVRRILETSGGNQHHVNVMMLDPLTEEYAKDNKIAGFMTQQYDVERAVNNFVVSPMLQQQMASDATFQAMSSEDQARTYDTAGGVISRMLADTAQMNNQDRASFFNKNLAPEIEARLVEQGVPKAEAADQAKRIAAQVSDPSNLEALRATEGMVLSQRFGMNSVERGQMYGAGKAERVQQEDTRAAAQAAKRAAADLGYEGTPVQRISDYLNEIGGSGENFTMSGFMKSVMPTIKDTEVGRKYAKDLDPAFKLLAEKRGDVFVNDQYIDELREDKDYAQLKKLAGLGDEHKIISGRQLETLREERLQKELSTPDGTLSEEKVNAAYKEMVGGSAKGLTTEQKLEEIRASKKQQGALDAVIASEQKALTEDQLVVKARGAKGQAREGREQEAEDILKTEAGLIYGKDKDKGQAAVSAMFRSVGLDDMSAEEMRRFADLTEDSSEVGQQRLLEEIDALAASGTQKEELKTLLQGRQKATNYDLDQAGVQPSMKQTEDGVVDKTNIEANTVVINGAKYVDKDGKPLFTGDGGEHGPATASTSVRDRANAIVDENYSKVGTLGNSTAFTDKEAEDAAGMLAQELGIPRKDATAIMQSIKADRDQNSNQFELFSSEKTPYADKLNTSAQEIVSQTYSQKTAFSEEDTAAAIEQLRKQTGATAEEAKKIIGEQIESQKPSRTWSEWWWGEDEKKDAGPEAEKKPDQPKEPPKPIVPRPTDAYQVSDQKQYDREKLGVPEKITPEQQAVVDRVSKDPTGKLLAKEMTNVFDASTREAVLTLPDDEAVALFDKFTPEAQQQGLEQLATAENSRFLTKEQKENAGRLQQAITNARGDDASPVPQIAATTGMSREEAQQLVANSSDPLTEIYSRGSDFIPKSGASTMSPEQVAQLAADYAADPLTELYSRGSDFSQQASDIQLVSSSELRQFRPSQDVETISRQLMAAAPASGGAAGVGAKQDQTLRVTGTLSLQGLQDVLLSARGQQSVAVEGSGAPIVMDPPNMYSNPGAPPQDAGYTA